uniref:Uncharacterized protein n=1 Tax=Bactrocera latifrons TaxID=174628 RepID=A0A0K8UVX3_BACLA
MGSSRSSRSPLKRHHHKNKHKKRGKDRNRRKNGVHGSDRSEEKYRNTISINKKNKCRVSINHEFEKDVRETRHSKYRKQTYIANSSSDSQDSEEYCTYSVDKKRKRQKEIETSLEQINRTKRQEDEERQLGNSFRRESLFIKNMDFKHLSCDTKLPVVVEIAAKTDEFDFAVGLPDIEIPQTDDENGTDFSAGSSDEYVPDSDDDALALADELDNSVIKTADVVLEEIADCGDTYINNKNENGRNILTRKTKIKSHKWVQNKRKYHRSKGNPYVTKSGKRVEERFPKPIDCKCRHNCTENFSEEERTEINAEYWNLGDYSRQRLFLANCVKIEKCKRTLTIISRRANTLNYTLKAKQVCRKFFLKYFELVRRRNICVSQEDVPK